MPHDSDSFWLSVFRKSPIIGTVMAIGGIAGLALGCYIFWPAVNDRWVRGAARVIVCSVFAITCGGIFAGLIVGVIIDSTINAFRGDRPKKRRKPEQSIKRIYDGD